MTQTQHQPFTEDELRGLFEDAFGDWQVIVTHVQRGWITRARMRGQRVEGWVMLNGVRVGKFSRRLNDDRCSVNHTSLNLDEDARGKGFASQWVARCRERYRSMGIERIDVDAIEDGRIVWARMGFEVTDAAEWDDLLNRAQCIEGVDAAAVEALRDGTPCVLALAEVSVADAGSALARLDWSGSMPA